MKYLIPILCTVALLAGCVTNNAKVDTAANTAVAETPKAVADMDQLQLRDGLMYFEGAPFTGVAVKKWPKGQKFSEGTYKAGKRDGPATVWYANGQKAREYTYKDDKLDGLWTRWYENGQKKYEGTYKDGEFISSKYWDEEGNPTSAPP